MFLTGAAQVVFMVGYPVSQVQLPALFNARFEQAGADLALVPLDTAPSALEALLSMVHTTSNCLGLVLTAPHKQAAARMATTLTSRARRIGAVNVLRKTEQGLEGDMFDGDGFWNGARLNGFDPMGRSLALVGAGAAARAIALEFIHRGGRSIVFRTTDASERAGMLAMCAESSPWTPDQALDDVDIVVNATPIGMQHAPGLAVDAHDLKQLRADVWVADLVTQPMETPLLRAAADLGMRTLNGASTALGQLGSVASFLRIDIGTEAV